MIAIEVDRVKDAINRRKHGIALAAAAVLFEGPILRQADERFGARAGRSAKLMRKPIPRKSRARTRRRKLQRPSAKEIRHAAQQAAKTAARQTDRDVARAIAKDPDTFEADPSRLVAIRPEDIDVARIRSSLGLTQRGFAAATGVPHRLISDWEQGRKKPSAAARAFLLLVEEFGEKALKRLERCAAA